MTMIMLTKAKKEPFQMGKTHRNDPMQHQYEAEDKMMELYDRLASQFARRVEARRSGKARA